MSGRRVATWLSEFPDSDRDTIAKLKSDNQSAENAVARRTGIARPQKKTKVTHASVASFFTSAPSSSSASTAAGQPTFAPASTVGTDAASAMQDVDGTLTVDGRTDVDGEGDVQMDGGDSEPEDTQDD